MQQNRRWPLMVFLHGAGETGTDLDYLYEAEGATGALPHLASLSAAAVASQSADDVHRWSVGVRGLQEYVLLAPLSDLTWRSDDNCAAALELIRKTIREQPIDPRSVIITGVSLGGYGALRLAGSAPDLFAGVAPLCGFAPPLEMADWATAFAKADMPVLLSHGVNDEIVPYAASEAIQRACKTAQVPRAELWRLDPAADPVGHPGTGHAAWRNTYADDRFWRWAAAAQKKS
jgi:predicted peptidase